MGVCSETFANKQQKLTERVSNTLFTQTQTDMLIDRQTDRDACTRIQHTHTCTHTHACTNTPTHTRTHTYIHTHTRARTHADTHVVQERDREREY